MPVDTSFIKRVLYAVILLFLLEQRAGAQVPETQLRSLSGTISGQTGVFIRVLETGQSTSFNAGKFFPMQSVYKLPIAMAVLDAIRLGRLGLDQEISLTEPDYIPQNGHSPLRDRFPHGCRLSIRDLIKYSIVESDGSASDVLLRISGGPAAVTRYVRRSGIHGMTIATTETAQLIAQNIQYSNSSTPEAAAQLLGKLFAKNTLRADLRSMLIDDLTASISGQERIKALLPKGTAVAHKTGTAATAAKGLSAATNDAGIVTLPDGRHLAIVVFIRDSYSSLEKREAVIAHIAKAAFDAYKSRPGK